MNTETQTCTHEPCNCMVKEPSGGDAYCSPACAEHDHDEEQTTCPCGHPPCDEA